MSAASGMYVKRPRLPAASRDRNRRSTSGPKPTVNTRTSRLSAFAASITAGTSERPSVKNSTTRGRPAPSSCVASAAPSAAARLVPPPSRTIST